MMLLVSAAESRITSHQGSQGPTEMRQPLNADSVCLSADESAALALAGEGITDRGLRYLTLLPLRHTPKQETPLILLSHKIQNQVYEVASSLKMS